MGERKFCYRCMEKYDEKLHICPSCGYDDSTPCNPMYITPGTILHDRYLVGVLLEYNGEGAYYAGHDNSTGCKVLIREYMPVNLCTRVKNKAVISVNYNNLAKYKAFMAEYTELNKSLARLRNNSNINPVLDMFAENNTTYIIFEDIGGSKILEYLKDNAGELSWEQVSKLFPPLFTTIGILHNAGIIHRAISPDTLYINAKGELKLSGFCVSAVRTANAGLEYELFKGYAAPEQYSSSSSSHQGSWTDVYGVCALLYRCLTGCMPIDAKDRQKHDDLCEPAALNPKIPKHVSKVIMNGMNLSWRDRIQTITELVTRLFEQPAQPEKTVTPPVTATSPPPANTQYNQQIQQQQYTPPPPPVQQYVQPTYEENQDSKKNSKNENKYKYEKVNAVDKLKVPILIAILLLAILLTIALLLANAIKPDKKDGKNQEDTTSSTAEDNVVTGETEEDIVNFDSELNTLIPDLKGKFYDSTVEKYADFFTFEAEYSYNDDFEADMIFEQDPEPDTSVSSGSLIKVKVSKGPDNVKIPDYSGVTVSQYENLLKENNISNYSLIVSTNYWAEPDTITMIELDGQEVFGGNDYVNSENKTLIVYYVPAPETEPTTKSSSYSTNTDSNPSEEDTTENVTEYSEDYQYYYDDNSGYDDSDYNNGESYDYDNGYDYDENYNGYDDDNDEDYNENDYSYYW